MRFVTLEDEYGPVEAVLFRSAIASLADPDINPGRILLRVG
jgi:hypothetical protein